MFERDDHGPGIESLKASNKNTTGPASDGLDESPSIVGPKIKPEDMDSDWGNEQRADMDERGRSPD